MKKCRQWLKITMIAAAAIIPLLHGCQTVSGSGRSQLMLISESREKELGESAWKELRAKEKVSGDRVWNAALQRVGSHLSAAVGRSDYRWEFVVFANDTPNAFCLPGGKVGVYSGLFAYTANDAELATVVGHEIAHAIARHGGERISQGMVQQLGAEVLNATVDDDRVVQAYGIGTNLGAILPYSRKHEYEADYLGLKYMAMAGYDPRAALSFWEKFGKLDRSSKLEEFFSTHPLSEARLEDLRRALPEALKLYQAAPVKRGLGEVYRTSAAMPPVAPIAVPTPPPVAAAGLTATPAPVKPAGIAIAGPTAPPPSGGIAGAGFRSCVRSDLGFAVGYYGDWQVASSGMSMIFTAPSREEVVSIQAVNSVDNGGAYEGVSDLVDAMYRQIAASSSSSRVYRNEPTELQGRLGQEFYVDVHKNNQQYRQWIVIFPRRDGRMFYVFSYTARAAQFSESLSRARKVLQSFRFINDNSGGKKTGKKKKRV